MKALLLLFATVGFVSEASGAPLVTAFERFHSKAASVEGGRLLFNELGCVNCHDVKTGLPSRSGPAIAGVTARLNAAWLREFLSNPDGAHHGSGMPQMLHGYEPVDIEAAIQYLGSLKPKGSAKLKVSRHTNARRGGELFHSVGCVACHAPRKDFKLGETIPSEADFTHASVTLPELKAKTSLAHLADFLLDPLKVRPDGRMPHMGLNEDDATDIAAYLIGFESSDPRLSPEVKSIATDAALIERGRKIVAEARCAACHELPRDVGVEKVALKGAVGACLNPDTVKGIPRYGLSKAQVDALKSFLSAPGAEWSPTEQAALTVQSLNCVACHERDGIGGPDAARKHYFEGDHNLGDTGRYPPPLTAVGRKLQTDWMQKVLAGENRVRPYLKTRMPVYGASVQHLEKVLEEADTVVSSPLPGGDDTAGRKLLGTVGGIGCITCHRWGERASLGIQALDLSNLGQRIRPEWLYEYLLNPAAYRPGTLMPSFWPGGISSNMAILGGDTAKQIASIYSFAKSANGEPEGFPTAGSSEFELVPKDRPIVQRTFMEGVGTHAILVGFPTGVHMAYDGQKGVPALMWKGRFFDAYNTWFSRFAPFEKPLDPNVVRWPSSDRSDEKDGVRFTGYRLEPSGSPVFITMKSGARIEDRFEGIEGGLRRVLVSADPAVEPEITHPADVSVSEEPGSRKGHRSFTYLWK